MQGNNYEQVYGPNGPGSNTQSPQLYKYIWYIYNVYIMHTHTHTHTHTYHLNFQTGLIMSWNQDFQEKYQQAQIGTDDTI